MIKNEVEHFTEDESLRGRINKFSASLGEKTSLEVYRWDGCLKARIYHLDSHYPFIELDNRIYDKVTIHLVARNAMGNGYSILKAVDVYKVEELLDMPGVPNEVKKVILFHLDVFKDVKN